MKALQWNEVISAAVAHAEKPAVWVNNGLEYEDPKDSEIWKFIMDQVRQLYNDPEKFYSPMSSLVYRGLFLFDTVAEQQLFYSIFEQPLTYSSAVYACTYNAAGVCENENT
jgi:hypothetical protein